MSLTIEPVKQENYQSIQRLVGLSVHVGKYAALGYLAARITQLSLPAAGALFGLAYAITSLVLNAALDKLLGNSTLVQCIKAVTILPVIGISIAACSLAGYTISLPSAILFVVAMGVSNFVISTIFNVIRGLIASSKPVHY